MVNFIDFISKCNCQNGFTGLNCNQTSCNNYCLNEGTCVQDTNGLKYFEHYWIETIFHFFIFLNQNSSNPSCFCQSGFTGRICESLNNPCSSNPCTRNQGVCVSQYFGYFQCVCLVGFTGQSCEVKILLCRYNFSSAKIRLFNNL